MQSCKMHRPRRSCSNPSLNEFLSATDLQTDATFPLNQSLLSKTSRGYRPSPLVRGEYEFLNQNTIIHCTQSNPQISMAGSTTSEPDLNSIPLKQQKKGRKKNPILDEVSLDFSQDASDASLLAAESITLRNLGSPPVASGGAILKKTGPKGRKKKDEQQKNESIDSLVASQLRRSTVKQNELLESMRIMINETVAKVVESSSNAVRDEINSLKTSFNSQIKKLSDKETRHHIESSINVKEELEKINQKLSNFDELKNYVDSSLYHHENRLTKCEEKFETELNDFSDKLTALDVQESTHHKSISTKLNKFDQDYEKIVQTAKRIDDNLN